MSGRQHGGFGPSHEGHGEHEGHGSGRGFGPGGRGRGPWSRRDADVELPDAKDAGPWFTGRLPDDWFVGAPNVEVDDNEILVIGELAAPQVSGDADPTGAAAEGRASRFREDTRQERIGIARQAQERYGRTVSWGVKINGTEHLYTHVQARGVVSLSRAQRRQIDELVATHAVGSRSAALSAALDYGLAHSGDWTTTAPAGDAVPSTTE